MTIQKLQAYWISARPKTLVAAFLPLGATWVLVLSKNIEYSFTFLVLALIAALLVQVATNYWNDIFDARKGADTSKRLGPKRGLHSGVLSIQDLSQAAFLLNIAALLVATPIFMERSWGLLLLGLLCVALSVSYTGGPFPLAYLGLGEVFVLIFFGWVPVFFSYYVATGSFSSEAHLLGLQVGLLSCVLITINNLRDEAEDRAAHKKTLVVKFGRKFGLCLLALELFMPYLLLFYWMNRHLKQNFLAVFLVFPLAVIIFKGLAVEKASPRLNRYLALSSLHALLFLMLFAWALI
jgi:1,4-dihydroxy-2-naphthoate octaprenyltransferase